MLLLPIYRRRYATSCVAGPPGHLEGLSAVGVREIDTVRLLVDLHRLLVHLVLEDQLLQVEERPLVVGARATAGDTGIRTTTGMGEVGLKKNHLN